MNPKPKGKAETMSGAKLSKAELRQFTGSENWYRHGLARNILFTDGAKYVADQGGAYWLLDEIALAQRGNSRVAAEEFQVWKLAVKPDRTATLTCDDGNGNVVSSKPIPFTDFPANEIELWFTNNTIYLPSEH
jgi:prepilin-type processing-associated H-X9-DG protein